MRIAVTGFAKGKTIRINVEKLLHPSMRDASSTSSGMALR